ncbi:MAG: hypothetical protein GWN84_20605 [Gammaproteobacteria bacterium]|nr:hypothetical protein [Gammaproteobacteria bacterium]NIR85163.1 hypothetical protein [Gammaproteobacteria bacterium]NIU06212.1 hypothetical protein [Gammaproteobacteria bacterium]NIX87485.1 hypothetical protein [Gammaproteobacteria bacterium]
MTRFAAAVAFVLLSACHLVDTPPTERCTAQHVWEDYHLQHDALRPVVRDESAYAPDLAAWNELGTPIQLEPAGAGFELRVTDGGDESSGWLGLATVRIDGDSHITEATVTMNRTLLAGYKPVVADHVLCQELGHLLGLDHQRGVPDSCMDDCATRPTYAEWMACLEAPAGTTPNVHDGEQLEDIYAHAVDPGAPPPEGPGCVGVVVIHAFPAGPPPGVAAPASGGPGTGAAPPRGPL